MTASPAPAAADARRLLLLRHGHAAPLPASASQGDHGRPLDPRGRRDIASLAMRLHALDLHPDTVLVSTALRTRQSWEQLALCPPDPALVSLLDRLYLAEPRELCIVLAENAGDSRTLMLVGHNPGLHQLSLLLGHRAGELPPALRDGLPTAHLVTIEFAGNWQALAQERAEIRQIRMISP